jgi:autotransporter-associated beta strand protein
MPLNSDVSKFLFERRGAKSSRGRRWTQAGSSAKRRRWLLPFRLEHLQPRILFSWIGATSGSTNDFAHDYNNIFNWSGGVINDDFSTVTLTANTTIYFTTNRTTSGNLNLGYSGNFNLTLESSGLLGHTLAINGGVTGDFGGAANGRTVTIGSTNALFSLNLDLDGGSRTLNVDTGDTLILQNGLADGTLIKTGGGTLTLPAANSFAGGTTLAAGTLDINSAAALGTGALVIDGGTTIDNTSGSSIGLSTNNAQTWNGDFTFVGSSALNFGNGAVTLGGNRQITVNGAALTVGGNIGDGGNGYSITKAGAGTFVLGGASTYSGGTTVNAGLLQVINSSGATASITPTPLGAISSTATVDSGATLWLDYLLGSTNNNVTYANAFSGAGTLKVTTPGSGSPYQSAAILSGNLGGLTGTLDLYPNSGSIGKTQLAGAVNGDQPSSSCTIKIEAGTTLYLIAPLTYASAIDVYGMGNSENLGAIRLEGSAVVSGLVTLMANSSIGGYLDASLNPSTGTISGVISDGGHGYSLTKFGPGSFALSGSNTYSGGTTLSAGILALNNSSAIGTGAFTISGGTIDNTSGAAIALSTNNAQSWNANFTFVGTDDLNLGTGPVTMGATRTITLDAGNLTVGGNIAGGASTLNITGAGRLILSGTNTFASVNIADASGGTSIVRAASSGALGSGSVILNGAGTDGALELSGGITISNAITLWGRASGAVGIESVSGNNTLSGAISINTGGSFYTIQSDSGAGLTLSSPTLWGSTPSGSRVVNLQGGGVGRISGSIGNGSGVVSINEISSGAWALSGANTFSGGTTLTSGTLDLNNAAAAGSGTLTVDGGTLDNTSASSITLNNNPQIWNGNFIFGGTNPLDLGSGAVALGANLQLTVAAGTLREDGIVSGTYGLTKTGAGTFMLTGASTFSGGNTINAGVELVNNTSGSGAGSGTITVNSGGTLGGTGSLTGAVGVNAGGTVLPGSGGTGILATGNISIAPGGIVNAVINNSTAGSGYDQLNVTGTVNLTGSTLSISGTRPIHVGDQITVIKNDGSDPVVGTFSGLAQGAAISLNGANYAINYHGGDGNDVVLTDTGPYVAVVASATPATVAGTSTALSVLGADAGGESGLTYSWTVLSKPAGALNPTFSLNGTNSAKNTTATFFQAGSYSFNVTITDAGGLSTTSSVNVTVNESLTSIVVAPANNTIETATPQPFTATALDQFGQAMAAQPAFTWSVTGVGSIDTSGLYTAPGAPGSATISATSGLVVGSTSLTVVTAGTAVASPGVITATTTNLSVIGGATTGVTYTWSILTQPVGATSPTFSDNASSSAQSTTATFFDPGNYTLQVAINNGTVTTQDVSVTVVQTLGSIVVSPGTSTLNENGQQQFSAVGYDQFDVAMPSQPSVSWTVSSGGGAIDGTGLFTAAGSGAAGPVTIAAISGSISGSATITVSNAAPTVATGAAASPAPVTGSSTLLSVRGADDGGESNLTYTWSTVGTPPAAVNLSANNSNAAKNTTATFAVAGRYHFLVTITDAEGLSVTSAVSVTVGQTLTRLAITPPVVTLNENAQQQFSVAALDQFDNPMAVTPAMTWSIASGVGSIDALGLYSSPGEAGVATVSVSSGSVSQTAVVTIDNAAPTVAIAAAAPPVITGTSASLSVLGADDGGESNLIYIWSLTGTVPSPVTLSANGDNASKNVTATFSAAGYYNFQVRIVDAGGAGAVSNVTVQVVPTLASIAVTPAHSTLDSSASEQFLALGIDQFGVPLSTQPPFTWSTLDNVGTIDSTGRYSAPGSSSGTATIFASSGNFRGSATVVLVNDQGQVVVPAPSNGSTSGSGASSGSGGGSGQDSGTDGILIQPSDPTGGGAVTPSQSSGQSSANVFSDTPISATATVAQGDDVFISPPKPARTPPPISPPKGSIQPGSSEVSIVKSTPEPPARVTVAAVPAAVIVVAQPTPAPTAFVPDQLVSTVPDQVFKFLAPQSAMFQNLDSVKSDMTSQKSFKVAAGSATVISFGASAAYFIWLLRGGSLLSSLLSIFPAWKSMDPLPVLDSYENSRKRRKAGTASDGESLESLVDESNRAVHDPDGPTMRPLNETTRNRP